jgi:hypothetical protein
LILEISDINKKFINIFSPQVLDKIKVSDPGWEKLVPAYVAETIKSRKLFGYKD